ncbi:fatty acid desaturase family protein [Bacterioplanoides pacificum]|uniref:Fatty acid desaturase family protein n=1 Tax=Bacterioplanoides pacificum TaxID=1171596 RepID=A0ABV7VQQ9_9GAMM
MNSIHFPSGQRELYQGLSQRINQYFKQQHSHKSGNPALYRKAAVISLLFISSFAAIFVVPAGWNWLAWIGHGIATALVGFNIMHDGAHESFSRSRSVNRIAALSFNLIGSNRFYWAQKHNRNHHTFTNVDEIDEDIDAFGLFRMSPNQPRYRFHRWQHIYAWMLYPLTSLFWFFVLDYKAYFSRKIATRPFSQAMTLADHLEFWFSKALYLALYLLLPASVLGWSLTLSGFLLMHAVLGFLFAVVFQLAHVVDKAEFPRPQSDEQQGGQAGQMGHEWAEHQLKTTVDFATHSRWITWALGGLNFQVEHHLFPRVSHIHYPQLHQLLRQECQQRNLTLRSYPSLPAALRGHYNHLRQLGRG